MKLGFLAEPGSQCFEAQLGLVYKTNVCQEDTSLGGLRSLLVKNRGVGLRGQVHKLFQ